MTNKYASIILICGLLSTGCNAAAISANASADKPQTSAAISDSPQAANTSANEIVLPANFALPGLSKLPAANSWDEALSRLSEADRGYVAQKNSQYFDTLRFADTQTQRRLAAQGFPMPEEWLAARAMSDAELERLADGGNRKARIMLIDRAIELAAPILRERGFDLKSDERALFTRFNLASAQATVLLNETRSPFAAYQYAATLSYGGQGQMAEIGAASFTLAEELGDVRADALRRAYFERHRGLDAETVLAGYSTLKSALGR